MDLKNTGLAKSTPSGTVCLDRRAIWRGPSGTVCLDGGPRLGPCGPSPRGVVWVGPKRDKWPLQELFKRFGLLPG